MSVLAGAAESESDSDSKRDREKDRERGCEEWGWRSKIDQEDI